MFTTEHQIVSFPELLSCPFLKVSIHQKTELYDFLKFTDKMEIDKIATLMPLLDPDFKITVIQKENINVLFKQSVDETPLNFDSGSDAFNHFNLIMGLISSLNKEISYLKHNYNNSSIFSRFISNIILTDKRYGIKKLPDLFDFSDAIYNKFKEFTPEQLSKHFIVKHQKFDDIKNMNFLIPKENIFQNRKAFILSHGVTTDIPFGVHDVSIKFKELNLSQHYCGELFNDDIVVVRILMIAEFSFGKTIPLYDNSLNYRYELKPNNHLKFEIFDDKDLAFEESKKMPYSPCTLHIF